MLGSKIAIARMSRFGAVRVGTLRAASPSRSRRIAATSGIHRNSSVEMKRSPPAAGLVIARMWRSATSRTSTNVNPSLGAAGIPSTSRWMACSE
jgi:hypothetical protein